MRARCTLLGVLALTTFSVSAQDIPAVSFEQLTIATSSVSLAGATRNPAGLSAAQFCTGLLETADVRIRVDGTAPTSTVGQLIPTGAMLSLRGADTIRQFAAIRTGASSGTLALTCYGVRGSGPSVEVLLAAAGASTTGTGSEVHANTPSLTDATIAAGTLTGIFAGNHTITGQATVAGRLFVRDEFDQGSFIMQDDMTVVSVTDGEVNVVFGSPLGIITFREELSKTISSWVNLDGEITISADDDNAEDGVEIVIGGRGTSTTTGMIVAGTSGACVSASFTIADISDTDQLTIGWRQNETFVDLADNMAYTVVSTVGINAVDGSIFSEQEVSEATDVDDSGVNWADGERRALKVCISAAGVPTAFYTAASPDATSPTYVAITMTETGSTLTAGTQLWPFISFVQGATPGADVNIQYIELSSAP